MCQSTKNSWYQHDTSDLKLKAEEPERECSKENSCLEEGWPDFNSWHHMWCLKYHQKWVWAQSQGQALSTSSEGLKHTTAHTNTKNWKSKYTKTLHKDNTDLSALVIFPLLGPHPVVLRAFSWLCTQDHSWQARMAIGGARDQTLACCCMQGKWPIHCTIYCSSTTFVNFIFSTYKLSDLPKEDADVEWIIAVSHQITYIFDKM